jgi:hypothetical protein
MMNFVDFWSGVAFESNGGGGGGGGGGSDNAPSTSLRPKARPADLANQPRFSQSNTQRENDDRARENAAAQKRVADKAAADKAARDRAAAADKAAADAAAADTARNTFIQNVANTFTPGDGKEYVGGVLVGGGSSGGSDISNTRPKARPDGLDTSVDETDFPSLGTPSDLAAANAADVAEQVRIDRLKNIALESGKENSFYQNTMNKITPGDGKEYIGGELVETGGSGTFGAGVKNFLGGANADDLAVGYVDGQRIFRRPDGTTYTRDSLGFIYDTAGPDTLDRADGGSGGSSLVIDEDNGDDPVFEKEEVVVEDPVVEPEACPIGYKKNPDTSPGAEPCIIDPFQDPFPCLEGYVLDPETQTCVPDTGDVTDTGGGTVIDPDSTDQPGFDGSGSFGGSGQSGPLNTSAYTQANPLSGLPTLAPGAGFSVPTPTVQPITIRQQGLASLPFRNG